MDRPGGPARRCLARGRRILSVVRRPSSVVGLPPLVPPSASLDRPHIHQPAPTSASANNGQRTKDERMIWSMKRILMIGLGFAIGVLALNALVTFWNIRNLIANGRWVIHTREAINAFDELLASVRDAES